MDLVRTIAAAATLFLFFSALLFPLGALIVSRTGLDARWKFWAALAASSFGYCLLLAAARLLGLPTGLISWFFRALALAALLLCLGRGTLAGYIDRTALRGVFFTSIYYLIAVCASAYPSGRIADVRPDSLQQISHLAIDNLIPYNVSRYFVEEISAQQLEVVPDWQLTDRGPLAGIFSAVVLMILGMRDGGNWLSAAPGVFFVFECFSIYLNVLSLLAVWWVCNWYFDRRTAACAMLLMCSSYFYFVNIYFSWPKFFSAAFILPAIAMFQIAASGTIIGLLFACALLAHESGVFVLLAFGFAVLIRALFSESGQYTAKLRLLGHAVFSGLLFYSPWLLYKWMSPKSGHHILYFNAFCFKDSSTISDLDPVNVLRLYLDQNSVAHILSVRAGNFFYPFNFFHAAGAYLEHWTSPFNLLSSVSHLVFYQFLYALGLPAFVLLAAATCRRSPGWSLLRLPAASAIGSLAFAALALACPLSTVNHVWAYAAFLIAVIPAARAAVEGGVPGALVFGLAVATNLAFALFCFGFGVAGFTAQHVTPHYVLALSVLVLFFYFAALREIYVDD